MGFLEPSFMNINLNLKDRIVLPEVFPSEGTIQEQITIRDIVNKIAITREDVDAYNIRVEGSTYTFDPNIDTSKEIEFTAAEYMVMQSACKKLDEEKKITQRTLDVCMKVLGYNV